MKVDHSLWDVKGKPSGFVLLFSSYVAWSVVPLCPHLSMLSIGLFVGGGRALTWHERICLAIGNSHSC